MVRKTTALSLGVLVLAAVAAIPAAAFDSGCVVCHRAAQADPNLRRFFDEWKDSAHAHHDVECSGCHQGDAQAADKETAHADRLDLNNPEILTNTCGGCHEGQLANFRKSRHYLKLQNHENAPTCVTCHGSRKSTALAPAEIPQTCRGCHNEQTGNHPNIPAEAGQIFSFYESTLKEMDAAQASIQAALATGRDLADHQQSLTQARAMLTELKAQWHAFNLGEAQSLISGIHIQANKALVVPTGWAAFPLWVKAVIILIALGVVAGLALTLRRGPQSNV